MKCIEHKVETDDDGKQSLQPDHQQQSNITSTSTPSPSSSSSSTASSDYQLPNSQNGAVSCNSPSMYSSTGSVSSLSTTSPRPPLSVNPATPTSSPVYSPLQPRSQLNNHSPETETSLHTSVSTDSIPLATSASVPFQNSPQSSGTEVQNGVQSPPDAPQNGIQSPPFVQNRVQSPPSVSGSIFSTASTNSGMILPAQRNFSSSSGSLSPDSCSPYTSPISTVSTLPPSSAWSPEMGTSLHTSVSTDSIPSVTSGSVPFQNSPQSSDFVPSAPPPPISTTFSSQIPTDFSFSNNSTAYHQNFDNFSNFVPGLDFTMLEPQQFGSSSFSQVHPEDSVLQHLLDEVIALNDDSGFNGATIPGNGTVNMDNTFILDSMPNSNSNSSASFQGKRAHGITDKIDSSCATT